MVILTDIFVSLGLISILIFVRPTSTLIAITIFGIFGIVYFLVLKKKLFIWGKQRQFFDSQKIKYAQESLLGIKEIKIYNKEKYFENMFSDKVDSREIIQHKMRVVGPLPRFFVELLTITFFLAIIYLFFDNNDNFSEFIPEISFYVASFIRLIPACVKIINNVQSLRLAQPILNNLHSEFSSHSENTINKSKKEKIEFRKNIIFNNIFFLQKF